MACATAFCKLFCVYSTSAFACIVEPVVAATMLHIQDLDTCIEALHALYFATHVFFLGTPHAQHLLAHAEPLLTAVLRTHGTSEDALVPALHLLCRAAAHVEDVGPLMEAVRALSASPLLANGTLGPKVAAAYSSLQEREVRNVSSMCWLDASDFKLSVSGLRLELEVNLYFNLKFSLSAIMIWASSTLN
jgi:hypothetical protein